MDPIGTPLDNAVGYGCWHVARLLAARGARVDRLWHAASLGMLDRLEDLLALGGPLADWIVRALPGGRHARGGSGEHMHFAVCSAGPDSAGSEEAGHVPCRGVRVVRRLD